MCRYQKTCKLYERKIGYHDDCEYQCWSDLESWCTHDSVDICVDNFPPVEVRGDG